MQEMCQGEQQTAGLGGPHFCAVGLDVLLPRHPLFPPALPFSFSVSVSHSALFLFDWTLRQRHSGAIYRRVVLFYQPVSICVAVKYRGLPGCWRQQCSAAETRGAMWDRDWKWTTATLKIKRGYKRLMEWSQGLDGINVRVFAYSLSQGMWEGLFLSEKIQVRISGTTCVPVPRCLKSRWNRTEGSK